MYNESPLRGQSETPLTGLNGGRNWHYSSLNEQKPNPDTITHACPQCGEPVACGNVNGCETCWCANLPKMMPMPDDPDTQCLCEKCLRERIEENQKAAD